MESIGIGLKQRMGHANDFSNFVPEIELQMNIWKMPLKGLWNNPGFYIDFGIKASFLYEEIQIYLPFRLSKKDAIVDLGEIVQDEKILCALFNDECTRVKDIESCYYTVTKNNFESNNNKESFYLFPLAENNITILNDEDKIIGKYKSDKGTWINISIRDLPSQVNIRNESEILGKKEFYIRFRVHVNKSKDFAIARSLSNDLIQAAFSKIDLYDIRINEDRNLNKKVKEQFKTEGYVLARFRKAHIFYVASSKVSVNNGSRIKADSRIIEPHIWEKYEPPHDPDRVFIAHHWKHIPKQDNCKIVEGNKEFNKNFSSVDLFFTAVYPKIQVFTLLAYLFVVILLGCIGSWLSSQETLFPSSEKLYVCLGLISYIIIWKLRNFRCKYKLWFKEN